MKKVASLNDTKALDQQYKSGKGLVLVMARASLPDSHLRAAFVPTYVVHSHLGPSPLRTIPT